MNTNWMTKLLALTLITGFLVAAYQGTASSAQNRGIIVLGPITDAEAATLQSMREEEKLARDVYLTLYAQGQVQAFLNIAASEQNHMDALKKRLDAHGLADPVAGLGVGVFTAAFQPLYDELVARGSASLPAAYQVGVEIETMDIADLQAALGETKRSDLVRVYNNLLAGSYNHLAAFNKLLGITSSSVSGSALTAQTMAVTAGGNQSCPNFIDENGDGICDLKGTNPGCKGLGQGGQQGCGQGPNFIDANGDGICDLKGTNSGQRQNGSGQKGRRGGNRGGNGVGNGGGNGGGNR